MSNWRTQHKKAWIAAGRCRQCGRAKSPDATYCTRCLAYAQKRVARGDYKGRAKTDNRDRPRVDGDWIYA